MQQSPRLVSLSGLLVIFALSTTAAAQHGHTSTQPSTTQNEVSMIGQLAELRAEVARLEAALQQNHQGMAGHDDDAASHQPGMAGMGMDGMGAAKQDPGMGSMSGMSTGSMDAGAGSGSMQGMGDKGMRGGGMGMMGQKPGMGMSSATASALPGFPGMSHLYHIGATGFFLNHNEHIELTTDQETALSQYQERSLLARNTASRKIDEAEQQLWELTASDEPDAALIETKVREIEKLRGNQRIEFIRAVGEAAKVLTADQRQGLLGQESQQPPADAKQHQH